MKSGGSKLVINCCAKFEVIKVGKFRRRVVRDEVSTDIVILVII